MTVDADGNAEAKSITVTRAAGVASYANFYEVPANGDHYVKATAPDALAATYTVTWPSVTGTLLTADGVGTALTALDGENIQVDTIDDDSIDFADVTCADLTMSDCGAITSSGAVAGTTGTFSGTLVGLMDVTPDTDAAIDLTNSAGCNGDVRINNDADAIDYTLPPAAAGLNCCFYGNAAGVITVDQADGTDTIFLNGASVGAGDAIDSPGAAGDFICLMAIDATNWITLGRSGTWVDGGTD